MSSQYSAWFVEGIDPGTIVTLDQPQSLWKILEKLNEHDYQVNGGGNGSEGDGLNSFASAKVLCCDPKKRSRLVAGGFIIWLVWDDIVPGLRLGDGYGAGTFWALESDGRVQVRVVFVNSLPKLVENRWYLLSAAKSLVWHWETQTLFFVGGFCESTWKPKRPLEVDAQSITAFEFATPDPKNRRRGDDLDRDTSRWQG